MHTHWTYKARKFSTVFGTSLPYRPISILPRELPSASTSKNTVLVILVTRKANKCATREYFNIYIYIYIHHTQACFYCCQKAYSTEAATPKSARTSRAVFILRLWFGHLKTPPGAETQTGVEASGQSSVRNVPPARMVFSRVLPGFGS